MRYQVATEERKTHHMGILGIENISITKPVTNGYAGGW